MTTFHLVVDEIVPVNSGPLSRPHVAPSWLSSARALHTDSRGNRRPRTSAAISGTSCSEAFWATPFRSPVFFELSKSRKETRAFRVRYETVGCDLRPILHKPKHTSLNLAAVEQLFGVKLDTLLKESP